ncbi:exodeoxyribonuclease VII small subunit [Moorena sp. SIO2C4]|uniref:exodeoxyribonuclease VII small subunit n=1 Tax=Moorena sp. SIO2C4 TaxID=2607824 RepID=UPI0013CD3E54|nr:exodeoxyribonuclease VII small subunit [Moorena sp. SIO2C4]NES45813.1 exodeoxyribonuclease VII small subunit [Moorena sp. SIO2C4]
METQSDSNLTDSNLTEIPSGETWNYEATVAKVETIIRKIETGELELADVFDQFSVAVQYLHQCEDFLDQRQQQMDLLIETLSDDSDF